MYQIKGEVIPRLQTLIGYQFNNTELGWEALQAKDTGGYPEGNKRLALVGDAYLKLRTLHLSYRAGEPVQNANSQLSSTVANSNIAQVGKAAGLEQFFNSHSGQQEGATDSQIVDTLRGVIGAVYEDGGEAALGGVLQRLGLL